MTVSYPLDTTGLASSNLIVDEIHTLTEVNSQDYRILIPKFAPFYLGNFQIKYTDQSGQTSILTEDVDYTLCLPYIGATRSIGQMLYGGITINNENLNGLLKVTYRTLGGDWVADSEYVLQALAEHVYNPRITVWDEVTNKPSMFPPINHDQSLDYVYGHQDLIDSINSLASTVANGPNPNVGIILHLTDTNNPHEVSKDQVGLGDVENLSIATDQEVQDITPVRKYITFDQLISVGLVGPDKDALILHLQDFDNPHQTNKAQIGLGSVANLPLASDQEVTNADSVDKYVTLRQVIMAINALSTITLQGSDITRAEMLYYSTGVGRKL